MDFYKGFDFEQSEKLIRLAFREDVGSGDVTSKYFIGKDSISKANIVIKSKGIIAGLKIFKQVYKIYDPYVNVNLIAKDGNKVMRGDIVASVNGNTRSILAAERLSLNILQRMSGIATRVNLLTKKLNNTSIKIIDTRKTTPNLRLFEKLAVRIGGGENHRMGLYDMILIKDNHIEASDGIENVLKKIIKIKKKTELEIELEVKTLFEFETVIEKGKGLVDVVMLDNFKIEDVKKAVEMNRGYFKIEISGGVDEKNIIRYKRIKGIDYISSGAVTHSVSSMDISLDFIA